MVHLIALLQSPQNGHRVLHRGLLHQNRLETPFQGRILFNIFPVLVQSGGADAVQLPPGQHGLEHIARVQGAVPLPRPHNGVELVDKEKDLAVAVLHVLQHRLQSLLKFPPVLGPRHQGAHIQGKNLLVLQPLGHIPPDNPLGQAFHHRRLSHPRLPDQHRVVLGLPGEDPDNVPDLPVPADDRVKLVVPGLLHQLLAVFFQGVIGGLRVVAGDSLIAPDCGERLEKALPGDAVLLPDGLNLPVGLLEHGQEKMLHGHILISQLLCLVLRPQKHIVQILAHIGLSPLNLGALCHRPLCAVHKMLLLDLHLLYQLQNQTVLQSQQAVQQMLLFNLLISVLIGCLFAPFHSLEGFLRKFLYVHNDSILPAWGVSENFLVL